MDSSKIFPLEIKYSSSHCVERVSIINFLLIFFFLSKEKIRSRQTPSIMEKREILGSGDDFDDGRRREGKGER